jgi:hypothetical protein
MNFDLGKQNAAPGTKLTVKTVKFEEKSVLVEDSNGVIYRSYYDKQPLWQTEGKPYLGVVGATLWGVVGDSTTPGGYLRFFVRKFISLPEPQQPTIPFDASNDVPRSPYDVVSKQLDETLSSLVESKPEAKPPAKPIRPMCHVSIEEASTQLQFVSHELGKPMTFVANKCLEHGIKPMVFLACGGKV